jgi:predicted CoA-binding protein
MSSDAAPGKDTGPCQGSAESTAQAAQRIIAATRTIAVVGASENPWRDSQRVMAYLLEVGFEVHPVNPNFSEVLGRTCVARLEDIGAGIDTVVCFRRSSQIVPIAQSAIAIGARYLWMQLGVINREACLIARTAGLSVVMDRCIMVDHRRMERAD